MKQIIFQGITPQQLTEQFKELLKLELQEFKSNSDSKPNKEYLTRKETREMLSISYPTLSDWVNKGILKAHRIESRVYFLRSDVEQAFQPINY